MKTKGLFMLFFALFFCAITAQTSSPYIVTNLEWVNNFSARSSRENVPSAVDENGYIYTIGYTISGIGQMNSVVQKIDSNGVTVWWKTYNGPGNADDRALSVALSDSGFIYICGESVGSGTGKDFFTIKYDQAGNQKWVSRFNGSGNGADVAIGLVVDDSGNVYTAGRSTNSAGNFDYCVVKYNASGTQQWAYTYNGTAAGDDRPRAIVLSDSNRVFVTGYTTSTSVLKDITTIRISTTSGTADWIKTINGSANGNDEGQSLVMDGYDPVIVGSIINSGSNSNYFIAKLNRTNGSITWSNTYDAYGNSDLAYSVAVNDSGEFGVVGFAMNSTYEYHTVIYSNSGNQIATNAYPINISTPNIAPKISIDTIANYFYIAGETNNGTSNIDVVVYQVSRTGNREWLYKYNGTGNGTDCGTDVAVNSWGQLFVVAQTDNSSGTIDMTTFRLSQTPVYVPVDLELGDINHHFYKNLGQILNTNLASASDVLYYSEDAYPVEYIKKNAMSFVMGIVDTSSSTTDTLERIDMTFNDVNPYAQFYEFDTATFYVNYILGHLSSPVSNLKGHHRLFAPNYLKGVDLHYYSNRDGIKIYFVVRPGYDPNIINLIFSGQQSVGINANNELEVIGILDTLTFKAPEIYNIDTTLVAIPASGGGWDSLGTNSYRINPGTYDTTWPLVISISQKTYNTNAVVAVNGNLQWSTYVGGVQVDQLLDVEHNSANTIVGGRNFGGNYPTSTGILTTNTGLTMNVLTRFNSADQRTWSTYLGGTSNSCGSSPGSTFYDMDVDRLGFVYVIGITTATNWNFPTPTSGQYFKGTNNGSGCNSGYLVKLDSSGQFMKWGTYIGKGGDVPKLYQISVNNNGTQLVVGGLSNVGGSLMFPAPTANCYFDTVSNLGIIMRFNSSGVIQYGTRIGANFAVKRVRFNSKDEYFIFGWTNAANNLPLISGGGYLDTVIGGTFDLYIGKFNTQDTIVWGTYVGGSGLDVEGQIAISDKDDIAICGYTNGNGYPTAGSGTVDNTYGGSDDIVITTFDSTLAMINSTYYGGNSSDYAYGLTYDRNGYLWVCGSSGVGSGFAPLQLTNFYYAGTFLQTPESYLIGYDPSFTKKVTTLFGGNGYYSGYPLTSYESGNALSINVNNDLYMAGETEANVNFPLSNTTGIAYYDTVITITSTYDNPSDGYVARFILSQAIIGMEESATDMNSFLVFPNPGTGEFTFVLRGEYDNKVNLEVYDMAGRLVASDWFMKNSAVEQKTVNLSNLSNGIYFITLRMKNNTLQTKIIISK